MSADQGTSIQKNSGDLSTEPITQEARGIDSRQEREENEEKMQIASEGDQELKVLPENEKEQDKEEAIIETTEKPRESSPSKTPTKRSSKSDHQQKTKKHEESEEGKTTTIPLTSLSKRLDKQNVQINKIIQILQPVQEQIKSTERQ
jgi:hypothetical protein